MFQRATCSLNAHATYLSLSHGPRHQPSATTWFTQSTSAIDAYRHIDGIVSGDQSASAAPWSTKLNNNNSSKKEIKKNEFSQSRKAFAFTWMKFDLIIHLQCGITFAYISHFIAHRMRRANARSKRDHVPLEWERENSFVDLQRFWCVVVGADAWRKALNSNQKLVRTVSVNRGTDDHREREVDASIFSLSHNTHMTNAAICCVPTRCTTTTSVCIPLLFASCFVYMVLSYVLNEILNSHEHSFRNERQNEGITKVSHCIQFSWANATVLFDLALVQSHFFRVFFFILSVLSLA